MLIVKEGDTHEIFWVVRDCTTGLPVDLTDTAIELHLQQGRNAPRTALAQVVPPATEGRIVHALDGSLSPGPWIYEIQLTRAGVISTAPTDGTGTLLVQADIL